MFTKYLTAIILLSFMGLVQGSDSDNTTVIDLSKLMKMEQLLGKIVQSRVVFVGETHDRYDHHLNQLAIIKSKHERDVELAIGLEFIQQPYQSVLDDYIAGRIDEAGMLKGTNYFERWGYDFRLYRPIFSYAREHGIPLIALNLDKDITDLVKSGGVEKLSAEQKNQLPSEIMRDDKNYEKRLRDIYMLHPADEKKFSSFIEIQLLWDESMAETAASWVNQHPEGHMVILAGTGHVIYGSGIPDRFKRRTTATTSSVINVSENTPFSSDMADYLIMSNEQKLPPSGILGVFLDTTISPPRISGFVDDSDAEQAGLEKNDQITRIGNHEISDFFDIKISLMDKKIGESVDVEVARDGLLFSSEKHISYQVKLK